MAVIAPSDLVVTVISSSRIDLTWKNNDNYDWIQVYRGKGNTEEDAIADLDSYLRRPGSSEYMEDKGWEFGVEVGLEADEWYAYKIFGFTVHPYDPSDFSNTDAGETLLTLAAPTLVVATPISDAEIDLTFKDNSEAEKWHRVQREISTDPGNWVFVIDLEPNREFYRDTELVADSLYTYKVHAMQEEGDLGNFALESAQVVTFDVPSKPVLTAIADADTQDKSIRIRWPGVVKGLWKTATPYLVNDWVTNDGISYICILEHTSEAVREPGIGISWITYWEVITGYKIEQDKDTEGYVEVATIGAGINNFLAIGLTPGSTYDFKIRAYNAAGDSAYSDPESKDALGAYVPTEFEKWIRDPNIEPVYLAEIYTKMALDTFTPTDGKDKTFQRTIGASDRGIDILEVFEGDEVTDPDNPTYVSYTAVADAAAVQTLVASFWFDYDSRTLYVHTSDDSDPDAGPFLIEAAFWLYFSTHKDIELKDINFDVNGRLNHYLPLLAKEDIPDITQEIKPYFEGSFSISSGSIAFKNGKIGGAYFFDIKYAAYTWINSKVILKAGRDDFTYELTGDNKQFKEIFTAYVDSKSCTDAKITFQLRDVRREMTQSIVLNKFNTTDYPYIDETFIGKLIPVIFGFRDLAIPIPIDMENQHFKFNDSNIGSRSASVDRVEKNDVELVEDTHYYIDLQRSIITFDRDGRFIIVAGVNDEIDFNEGNGNLNATLDPGTYTTAGLCAEIKEKMDGAGGTFTYTVGPTDIPAIAPKKFTIAAGADDVFSLLWKTGTNGKDGTDTSVGTTIGFHDDEDNVGKDSYEADEDMITVQKRDIIKVSCKGLVNSADEAIDNGAEIFKYLMNNHKGIQDSGLDLDSIYATKSAKPNVLALPIESEPSFDEIVRTIEHSMEAYTFQDEFGRLGIKPQQTTVASNAKYIISNHIFNHSQDKDRSTLFWKVNVYYNKDYDDNWEVKTTTENEIYWMYKITKKLDIYTYFTSPSHAADLAASVLNLLNKEQIEDELSMLLFDVMPGDLIKFSRTRFYDLDGAASEITLRVLRISKSPTSGRTSITAEVK